MPELPEVETSRRGIAPHIEGQVLSELQVRNGSLRWPVPIDLLKQLEGEKLQKVGRRAKYLLLYFTSGTMIVHLGMSGSLRIVSLETPIKKHDHIDAIFQNGSVLRLNDPRRFGCWLFTEADPMGHELLANLGPEPLSEDFTFEGFYQSSRGRSQSVKQWLMDNKTVVGVGNIYASESLFKARINPKVAAGRVSKKRLKSLYEAAIETLAMAIKQGGTSLRDFVGSDGKPGYFKQELQVYGREGQGCRVCETSIKSTVIGQRNTFYCPNCQRR